MVTCCGLHISYLQSSRCSRVKRFAEQAQSSRFLETEVKQGGKDVYT